MEFNLKYREDSFSKVVAVFSIRVHEIHMSHLLFLQIPEGEKNIYYDSLEGKKMSVHQFPPFLRDNHWLYPYVIFILRQQIYHNLFWYILNLPCWLPLYKQRLAFASAKELRLALIWNRDLWKSFNLLKWL